MTADHPDAAADPADPTVDLEDRDPLDRVAEEFAERCRRGESPSITEYEARYPRHVERIRSLLPTVAMMEQLKRATPPARGAEPTPPLPGRLGEFRVVRELGRGGMGIVYEAVQESLNRHVALKVIPHAHLDAKRLQRFQREAQAVARLHHTNIVPIFGVGEHEGLPYFAMQYIRGHGLDVLLESWRGAGPPAGPDRWRLVARLGIQAAEALDYAHEQGVLHRDIKPSNLLVDEHQTVWVTDFGLAKLAGREDLTAPGDVLGTLRYLAPEALRGEVDRRGDVYSLGLTLYELLTLSPPFGDSSTGELLRQVSEGEVVRPRRLVPEIPADLETIVLKAIAREPKERYPTAAALADDLRRFLEDRPILARRATPWERLWRWSRRNKATAALTATAAGSLLLAAVVGWAGYASTTRALRRADENVSLSLEVFEDLFETLAMRDTLLPPPLGSSWRRAAARPEPGDAGPTPGAQVGTHGDRKGPTRPPTGPFPPGPGGPGGRGGPFRRSFAEEDTALLERVLNFYDRFARRNATNPRLQGEAAWAYRKVGALYQILGRDRESENATARAVAMFEELVARYPHVPEYRSRLVDTYAIVDPWSAEPTALPRLERQLRRARDLVDGLVAASPGIVPYSEAQVHVNSRLGAVLQRLGRPDEAEECYRRAIALEGPIVERSPHYDRPRLDRATTREALAVLQAERGRLPEAKATLEASAEDLDVLAKGERVPPPLADRYASLSDLSKQIGEPELAEAMARRAAQVDARARQHFRRSPGREPGPPRLAH